MANVLNRTTKEYLESVNTPEYDPVWWIINPDLSLVGDTPSHHWQIESDDSVCLLSEEDRAHADLWLPYMGGGLPAAIALKIQMINAERDQHLNGGWIYNGVFYDSDAVSKQNIAGIMTLINTGYVLPDTFTFRSGHNEDISFDNASFTVFFQSSCIWAEMIYRTGWYHKAVVATLGTIPAVAAYNITLGWPIGYTPRA